MHGTLVKYTIAIGYDITHVIPIVTETAMLGVLNRIDKGNAVVMVCLDISAAFDTIHHARLLERLRDEFGVNSGALNWL